MLNIQVLSKTRNDLGEAIWWDHSSKLLHWSDITQGKLYTYNPLTKIETFKQFDGSLGCFAPCKNGNFLLGINLSFYIYNPKNNDLKILTHLKNEPKENRINDGTTDKNGRFWFGTITKEGHTKKNNGTLYRIDHTGKVEPFINNIFTPNGLAFNKSGNKMYFADTGKDIQTIWSFDYDLSKGKPSNKKVFANTKKLNGRPDGATIDKENHYWVAGVEGSQLIRYKPNGEIDNIFKLPILKPTKLVFGNTKLNNIYITSINTNQNQKNKVQLDNLNGSVLSLTNHSFKGIPLTSFNL